MPPAPLAVVSAREIVRFWRPDTRMLARAFLVRRLRGRETFVLRDYDSLWDSARDDLLVKNPGFGFYKTVDRDYLASHSEVETAGSAIYPLAEGHSHEHGHGDAEGGDK